MMTQRTWVSIGGLMGFLAVLMGSFGAHALDSQLGARARDVFETGVRYHMYHALAIVVVGCMPGPFVGRSLRVSGWFFLAGIVFFSGSLYLLAVTGARWLGMIAPLGGVLLMVGWATLCWTAVTGGRQHE